MNIYIICNNEREKMFLVFEKIISREQQIAEHRHQ